MDKALITPNPQFSMREAKRRYYQEHNIGFFKKFTESSLASQENTLVSIDGKSFWLSDIIVKNIKKPFREVEEILIKNSKMVWTDIKGDLTAVIKSNKSLKEIQSKLDLPE